MESQFKNIAGKFLATLMCVAIPVCGYAKDSTETAGDILVVALPATAYGTTFYLDDREGRMQFYKSFAAVLLATQGLKVTVKEERPDGSDNQSFPSGHASTAFQSASFVRKRYGWRYGIPAYVVASYIGYSRIDAEKHYLGDVVAGAAIGIVGAELLTTPMATVTVTPVITRHAVAISVTKAF